ncbi:hypothetical protein BASA81_001061 [Batrachochytrium salamandrivorans]|nr:hypothetical protein BASA81_001061 [Batrachochytrium salamandrivorans]
MAVGRNQGCWRAQPPTCLTMWKATALAMALAITVVLGEEEYCSNSCEFGFPGQCDDGGEGSVTATCPLGTDCRDCGVRSFLISTAGEEFTKSPTTATPTKRPTTTAPTKRPTTAPTKRPTTAPTKRPTTTAPTKRPTKLPTSKPTKLPLITKPTKLPTYRPTKLPTYKPTKRPSLTSTKWPTKNPVTKRPISPKPTKRPTVAPTRKLPTVRPTKRPSTRRPSTLLPTKRPSSLKPTTTEQKTWCTNQCSTANNGMCEDGGKLAVANSCEYGTDCGDCGSRDPLLVHPADDTDSPTKFPSLAPVFTASPTTVSPSPNIEELNCNDLCELANNGQCEDGVETAISSQCDPGTDCTDCGLRNVYTQNPSVSPTSQPSAAPSTLPTGSPSISPAVTLAPTNVPLQLPTTKPTAKPTVKGATLAPDAWNCNNLCLWARDGVCDDGGPDSRYNVCIPGSDCKDCGPRDRTAKPTR